MPLSSKVKSARHREHVNSDPAARAEYLARRRESYQRRKQQGKIHYVKSSELQDREKKKQREKWKAASKAYRDRKKMANPVLDLTPPSMESISPALLNVAVAPEPSENVDQVDPTLNYHFSPPVVSTPVRDERRNTSGQKLCNRLQKEKRMFKKQVLCLRKQLMEMRKLKENSRKREMRLMEKQRQRQVLSEKAKQKRQKRRSAERKQAVIQFLSRDENSFLLPGKKDTITKNKQKVQRRVLMKPLTELHTQYQTEVEQHLSMSYRQFTRHRPFYITEPRSRDRDTCACSEHENIRLLVNKLAHRGLLKTTSITELIGMIVCDPKNKACMDRVCTKCCFDEIDFPDTNCETVSWEQWERVTSTNGERNFANVAKQTHTGTTQELKELFQQKLEALAIHQFNWIHQTEQFRYIKQNLTEFEAVLHIDFSENYACKMSTEIQAYHFGGSRKQVTIHTAVLYTAHGNRSYATLSDSLRHDERAVWAHLEPILKELRATHQKITALRVISDGPVTQYRNKANFYLLSTVPFLSGFEYVTWNYSEGSHGKGAPDGIGGAVKRDADRHVLHGGELQTPEDVFKMLVEKSGSSIHHHWISTETINKYDDMIPEKLMTVKGTLKIHQVLSSQPAQITHREVSCFCSHTEMTTCLCYQPIQVDLRDTTCHTEDESSHSKPEQKSLEDIVGKFVIVTYDELPYVGHVLEVLGEEVKINAMHQSGDKNLFMWPETVDAIFYFKHEIQSVISEPEPATSRWSNLRSQDWKKFQSSWG